MEKMKTNNLPVTSREYKLMLKMERFADMENGLKEFWNLALFILKDRLKGEIIEEQYFNAKEKEEKRQKNKKERQTWYLDTEDFNLKSQGYILRVRKEEGKYKVSIKYRGDDRYFSACQPFPEKGTISEKAEFKFEEDILPFLKNKYSKSISITAKKLDPELTKIGDLWEWFPFLDQGFEKDLKFKIMDLPKDMPLKIVNSFTAYEVVYWLGIVKFGKEEVKCCASFWYLEKDFGSPVVGEFSFDYDMDEKSIENNALESYSASTIVKANAFFEILQKQKGRIDSTGTTKTNFAYQGL